MITNILSACCRQLIDLKYDHTYGATMENNQTDNELVLQGRMLSQNEHLAQLVIDFKMQLTATPIIPVVLDLCEINDLQSRAIGVILGVFKDCKANNRDFRIITSSEKTISLFKMLKLDKVISILKVER
jgi:anti-anti-sigma factor